MKIKYLPILLTFGIIMLSIGIYLGQKQSFKPTQETSDPQPKIKPSLPEAQVIPIKESEEIKKNNSIIYEYYLQLGAFKTPYFAETLNKKVAKRGYTVKIRKEKVKQETFNLVEVGPFSKFLQAQKHQKFLQKDNVELGKILIKKRIKN